MSHKLSRMVLAVVSFALLGFHNASAATLKVELTQANAAFPPACVKLLDQFSDFKRASGSVFFGDVNDVKATGENQFSFSFEAKLLVCSQVAPDQFAWQPVGYYDDIQFESTAGQFRKVVLEKSFIFQTPTPRVVAKTEIEKGASSTTRVTAKIDLTQALDEAQLGALNSGEKVHLMLQALPWGWANVFRDGQKTGILRGVGHPLVIEFDIQKQN